MPDLVPLPQEQVDAMVGMYKILSAPIRLKIALLLLQKESMPHALLMKEFSNFSDEEMNYHLSTLNEFGLVFSTMGRGFGRKIWHINKEFQSWLSQIIAATDSSKSA